MINSYAQELHAPLSEHEICDSELCCLLSLPSPTYHHPVPNLGKTIPSLQAVEKMGALLPSVACPILSLAQALQGHHQFGISVQH